jgi:protein-S-isoprenylcysteine O-methyltransferase Ste14
MALLTGTMLLVLLLLCLGSFSWGMRSFFVRPAHMTRGMKATTLAGAGSALLHVWAISLTHDLSAPGFYMSAAVYVCAVILFWWAVNANRSHPLRACFSENRPLHLNRRGPYSFVRHPFYCSYLLTCLAGLIATRNPWLLPTVIVMVVIYAIAAIREEEEFAHSPLAAEYRQYRQDTGRFFPRPRKLLAAFGDCRPVEAAYALLPGKLTK